MTHRLGRLAGAGLAALCALSLTLALPPHATPAASAASGGGTLTYIKDHDVWIARGDGTGARPLTTDGSAGLPYRAPSQSDTGIVAAVRYQNLVVMDQQGRVLAEIDPPRLPSSLGGTMDGSPVDAAISPDGALIAYTFAEHSCTNGCAWRTATGYVSTTGAGTPATYGTSFYADPSWVTGRRTLQSGGYGHHVMVHDIGSPTQQHWFDDGDIWYPSEDFGNVEVSPDGTLLAGVRGYGDDRDILTYRVDGNIRSGTLPGLPADACRLDGEASDKITDPTWSPDSTTLAFGAADGVWTFADNKLGCTGELRLLLPGASEPDWSAAPLSPPAPAGRAARAGRPARRRVTPRRSPP
ncbi:PD40 domain-containing protein [Nocardioides humi]|uniref:PD40 domain-containing protein n=1 Tax=Nocardioides humi TaxID=449461 RepID=UPI0011264C3A|nr:PD40 domain-containing protein [Nocardioides humi]